MKELSKHKCEYCIVTGILHTQEWDFEDERLESEKNKPESITYKPVEPIMSYVPSNINIECGDTYI